MKFFGSQQFKVSHHRAKRKKASHTAHKTVFGQSAETRRKMSMGMGGSDSNTWVAKKPLKRLGGMSDALSLAADLGFSVNPPPSQVHHFPHLIYCVCVYSFEF